MALICATVGLALGLAPLRDAWIGVAAMTISAVLLSRSALPPRCADVIFAGLWISMAATAASTYLPRRLADRVAVVVGLNAGAWAGALASVSDKSGDLSFALLLGLLFIPARWITVYGYHIVIRVIASWLIAIASLSIFVSLMPTPGYKLDHME